LLSNELKLFFKECFISLCPKRKNRGFSKLILQENPCEIKVKRHHFLKFLEDIKIWCLHWQKEVTDL